MLVKQGKSNLSNFNDSDFQEFQASEEFQALKAKKPYVSQKDFPSLYDKEA